MKYKIYTKVSNNLDDWRYTGQLNYLDNIVLKYSRFVASVANDHEHCAFCWETFSEYEDDLHTGYHTLDSKYWICSKCYNDFEHMFNWIVE